MTKLLADISFGFANVGPRGGSNASAPGPAR
jgi:hypothetical protein